MNINQLPQGSVTPIPPQTPQAPQQTPQGLNINNLPQGAVTPVQPQQSPSVGGFVENAVGSVGNLIGGVGNALLHPIQTVKNLGGAALGGVEEGANLIGGTNINNAQTQSFDALKSFYNDRYGISDLFSGNVDGAIQKMAQTFYKDPAGAAADFSMLLEGGGSLLSKLGDLSETSDVARAAQEGGTIAMGGTAADGTKVLPQANNFLAKAGRATSSAGEAINPVNLITKPIGAIADSKFVGNVAKGGFSQLTGIQPSDIDTITAHPEEFTASAIKNYNRQANADTIESALNSRQSDLTETGKGYAAFRTGATQIPVQTDYLKNLIENKTGLSVDGDGTGKFPYELKLTGDSSIGSASDVTKLQRNILDKWNPEFAKGYLTDKQFLNLRKDLGNLADYEGGIGKSSDLENLASKMRGQLNTDFRSQLPGLAETDAKFGQQASELKNLRQGILNKSGELNPAGVNRIANALGKGKDEFLAQLEEISPGITKKIAVGKAIEGIQSLKGNVVGTYGRTAGTIGAAAAGLTTGGPLGAIASALAEQIMTSPSVSVPILKMIGKASPLYDALQVALKNAGAAKIATAVSRAGTASQESQKRQIKIRLPQQPQLR